MRRFSTLVIAFAVVGTFGCLVAPSSTGITVSGGLMPLGTASAVEANGSHATAMSGPAIGLQGATLFALANCHGADATPAIGTRDGANAVSARTAAPQFALANCHEFIALPTGGPKLLAVSEANCHV
jgi:hypothetical protein